LQHHKLGEQVPLLQPLSDPLQCLASDSSAAMLFAVAGIIEPPQGANTGVHTSTFYRHIPS
jgi:hypothetical protein